MSQSLHHVSAGFILFKRDENGEPLYLLLLNSKGHWDFPKGHVEEGEELIDAAKRETQEETGIKNLKIYPLFHEVISYWYYEDGKRVKKDVHFFLAEALDEKVKLSWEHEAYKWARFEEAYALINFKEQKEVLKKAHEFIKKVLG